MIEFLTTKVIPRDDVALDMAILVGYGLIFCILAILVGIMWMISEKPSVRLKVNMTLFCVVLLTTGVTWGLLLLSLAMIPIYEIWRGSPEIGNFFKERQKIKAKMQTELLAHQKDMRELELGEQRRLLAEMKERDAEK